MIEFIKKHKTISNLILVLLSLLIIISLQVKNKNDRTILGELVFAIVSPIQSGMDFSLRWIADGWNNYVYLKNLNEENIRLRERLIKAEQQLVIKGELESRVQKLEELLEFKKAQKFQSEPAQVVGLSTSLQYRTVTINKGSSAGIERFDPVINNEGLVGMIAYNGPFTSQVQLLLDKNTAVSIIAEKSRARGILSGAEEDLLTIDYVDKLEPISMGEKILTSGMDGIYPPGLLVGTVIHITRGDELFLHVTVKPTVDFKHLENLIVLKKIALEENNINED